jgi:hypothetical protein
MGRITRLLAVAMLLLPAMAGSAEDAPSPPANQAAAGAMAPPGQAVTPTPPAARAAANPWAELAKALPWPIAAIVIAALLYKPLTGFITAIGGRITKLSLFKIELELKPAEAAASILLDDLRTATTPAEISDSSRTMLEQLQSATPAHYALISLGNGDKWWTSRLYIAAAMMQRMRSVQVFVFVEQTATSDQRLVAVAPVDQLRWALAQRYPWLEVAWVRANLTVLPSWPPATALPTGQPQPTLPAGAHWLPDPCAPGTLRMITSDTGAFEPVMARQIAEKFIDSLQQPALPPGAPQEHWQWLSAARGYERAQRVTRELLTLLLPHEARDAWVNDLRDVPRGERTRAVLRRRLTNFVALTLEDREFSDLTNRRALLEDMAASLGEEPESGPS